MRKIVNNDDDLSHEIARRKSARLSHLEWREEEGRIRKVNGV